ncbi:metal dependent phosphohydrolase [Alicyclobacillus hesperidum URH17-3-68]|nr:metal dependent phosphohydrolase [Alicyclobacillus hesperidum URH17-3-68]
MMGLVTTAFLAGHGKLPVGSAAKTAFDTLAVVVEIETRRGVILKAECTLATQLGRDFVCGLLRGWSLDDGVEPMIQQVKLHYHGAAKAAIIAALKDLEAEYARQVDA